MKTTDESWKEIEKAFIDFWTNIPPEDKPKRQVIKYRQIWKWLKDFLEYLGSFI